MQSVIRALYPPQCLICETLTDADFALCGPCWAATPFAGGLVCDACGVPLPGDSGGGAELCDDCLRVARPWAQGRAALVYRDGARRLVMALKHGDRTDLARPAGLWMARAAEPLLREGMIVAPVPLHWTRLVRRRYNQAALLAHRVARALGLPVCPDLLVRTRRTKPLGGGGRDERFAALSGAIAPHPRHGTRAQDRPVLMIDDVMTSGATMAAAAEAARAAGAAEVCVLTLARAAKDP